MTDSAPVAVVTGGSTGIGLSICEHLLESGYRVISLARRGSPTPHERLIDMEVDLSDPAATAAAGKKIAAEHDVRVLVHNAGVIRPDLLPDVDVTDLEYITRLHLEAAIILTQAFCPAMEKLGNGRIIVIGSRAMVGMVTRTSYAATKAGQVAMVRTWALELGDKGITVNCVAPGPIVTDMFHELIPEDDERKDQLAASIPVKRLGRPDDVARAVDFLIHPDNSFITGQTLFVCGGTSIGSLAL